MSKKLSKLIIKQLPNMNIVDGYLVETPVAHIACGFAYERPPSGMYISKFAFPLYYRANKLTPMFSNRLPPPEGRIPGSHWPDTVLAAEFIKRVEPFRAEVSALGDLEHFKRYLVECCTLRSPFIRRGFALTLIMLGEAKEAIQHLEILRDVPELKRSHPEFYLENNEILVRLLSGLESAQALLLQWEFETRQRLGLVA